MTTRVYQGTPLTPRGGYRFVTKSRGEGWCGCVPVERGGSDAGGGVQRAARLFAKLAVMLYSAALAGRPVSTTLPAISCRIKRAQERIGVEGHEGQRITN